MEQLGINKEKQRKMRARFGYSQQTSTAAAAAAAGSGPVLWPGMDGLGLHKLNEINAKDNDEDTEPTNSDVDYSDPQTTHVKDDTASVSSKHSR